MKILNNLSCVSALAMFLVGCVGVVHKDPSEVTALEVGVYKAGMTKGCKDQGRKSADPTRSDRLCDCVVSSLAAKMTNEEWQRATYFAQQRKDRDEHAVMAPHMPSTLSACRSASE
jgi:hypothetical protein